MDSSSLFLFPIMILSLCSGVVLGDEDIKIHSFCHSFQQIFTEILQWARPSTRHPGIKWWMKSDSLWLSWNLRLREWQRWLNHHLNKYKVNCKEGKYQESWGCLPKGCHLVWCFQGYDMVRFVFEKKLFWLHCWNEDSIISSENKVEGCSRGPSKTCEWLRPERW